MSKIRRIGVRLIDWAGSRKTRGLTRKRLVAVAAAGAAMTMAAACTAGTATSGNGGNAGGNAGGNSSQGAAAPYLSYSPCCSWNTTWSYNPYNVNALGIQNDFITLRLAIQNYPSLTDYTPQLADSWKVENNKLIVHIREGAKWQDGSPVTSKDVYDTAILDGTRGDGFWNDITGVKATDDHTVEFSLVKGQPIPLAENDILANILPYPSSVYGKFVTPQLEKDVPAYFAANKKDPDKAAKMPEFKRMGQTFKKLAAEKVDKLIGDGPFKLENITTKEAKLSKWDGFWGADKIKIGGLDYLNGANQTIYPQLFSNRADFSNVYLPPPILKRWSSTPNAHTALPLAFGFVLGFNNHEYPFNIKEVRQALAYVIPRKQMSDAAYGTAQGAGGTWKEVNTGISPTMEKLYLPQDKIDQLNKYPVDPAKATQLLESKGFKKKGGQWMMPNGKPFKMTLTANADTSDIVTSFDSAAKALTAFGIKADVNATSGAQQDADQHNGDFDAGMYFVGGNDPLNQFDAMLGTGQNYSSSGNYAGKRGLGFGPKVNVPGLGTVEINTTLDRQARQVAPGPKLKELTWDYAQMVNEQVPYIWYATKVYQFSYSDKNFTNWPPTDKNGSSPLWDIIGANMSAGMSLALQQGYVVPK
jgi:peptide/nickel transport system substrate-binding protein